MFSRPVLILLIIIILFVLIVSISDAFVLNRVDTENSILTEAEIIRARMLNGGLIAVMTILLIIVFYFMITWVESDSQQVQNELGIEGFKNAGTSGPRVFKRRETYFFDND